MRDFRIFFIHGYTASSKSDWYPNISKELNKLNVDYVIPDLPGIEKPHAQEWLAAIHKAVGSAKKSLVFVGHSLGTRAVLLYLEKYKPSVEKVFLIAAFANRTENAERNNGESYPDFFEHEINLKKIRPLVDKFIVIHSKDDSSIDYKQGVEIANDLEAELITFEGRDHFCDPENAYYILEVLRKKLCF